MLLLVALVIAAWRNVWLALVLRAVTAFFLFFVCFRRDWSGLDRLTDAAKNLTSVTQLPRSTQVILLVLFPLDLLFMVAFTYNYDWLGLALWTATIVPLAMALMIPVGGVAAFMTAQPARRALRDRRRPRPGPLVVVGYAVSSAQTYPGV